MNSQSTATGASLSQPGAPNSSPNTETLATESNPDPPSMDPTVQSNGSPEDPNPAGGTEDEEECGFCLFMKEGGCKDPFIEWEKCVEDAERFGEDIAEKCFEITHKLRVCMEAHSDYYEPLLRAEKSMMEEAEDKENQENGVEAVVVESETESSKKSEAEDVAAVIVEKPAQLAGPDAES